ncbi:MAG: c-type cytochrome [Steroidobacteraceae bacterium]
MYGRASRRASIGLLTIAATIFLANTANAIEFNSGELPGRTKAAIADFRAAVALEPDLQRGAALFAPCAACHAADGLGTTDGSIPAIAAQHVSVLVKQLVDFRHDRRWNERMRNFASQHNLSGPQELLDVAAYAESLPRWPPLEGGTGEGAALKLGKVVYHRYCAECHGPLGLGELHRMRPRLAGQRYQYLLRQLEETADRMRPGMDVTHVKLIGALFDAERKAVADYLSRLSPNLASTQYKTP